MGNPPPMAAEPTPEERIHGLAEFVRSTRGHVFLREADRAMILRPNKIFRLNDTAWEIMTGLYATAEEPDGAGEPGGRGAGALRVALCKSVLAPRALAGGSNI